MGRAARIAIPAAIVALIAMLIYVGTRPAVSSSKSLGGGLAAPDPADPAPGSLDPAAAEATITPREIRDHIAWLASDEMKGRDTPSPELERAAQYVAGEFKRLGLQPVGNGYFHWWTYGTELAPNALGLLEGSDPVLKSQVVIVGGHMDHIGVQGREVMNGADDNASGTTGVLELAEAFASMKVRPKRSILFITFSGEEKGLKGSEAYVANPPLPLEACVAMFNFDMIGRSVDKYLFIGGVGTSSEFPSMMKKANEGLDLMIETAPGGLAPSDNSNFHKKGMPVLFFFNNVHADYHRPDDIVDKINAEGEAAILKLGFRMIRATADLAERLPFTRIEKVALPHDFQERLRLRDAPAARRPRLGVMRDDDQPGFVIMRVDIGSPAAAAGFERGDVIVKIGERDVASYDDLRAAMEGVKFGDTVVVRVRRGSDERSVDVRFPE